MWAATHSRTLYGGWDMIWMIWMAPKIRSYAYSTWTWVTHSTVCEAADLTNRNTSKQVSQPISTSAKRHAVSSMPCLKLFRTLGSWNREGGSIQSPCLNSLASPSSNGPKLRNFVTFLHIYVRWSNATSQVLETCFATASRAQKQRATSYSIIWGVPNRHVGEGNTIDRFGSCCHWGRSRTSIKPHSSDIVPNEALCDAHSRAGVCSPCPGWSQLLSRGWPCGWRATLEKTRAWCSNIHTRCRGSILSITWQQAHFPKRSCQIPQQVRSCCIEGEHVPVHGFVRPICSDQNEHAA